jgi:tetratricopeptide (TPR) repeat protein
MSLADAGLLTTVCCGCAGYIRLGCIQQASGDLNTAKQLFEKAFELAPTEAARAGMVILLLRERCYCLVPAFLLTCCGAFVSEAHLYIGLLHAQRGEIEAARKRFDLVPPDVLS